jgi:hypothetical protein
MEESVDSAATLLTRTWTSESRFEVPPMTSDPDGFGIARDSPVSMASFADVEPATTVPSEGKTAPACTRTTSPRCSIIRGNESTAAALSAASLGGGNWFRSPGRDVGIFTSNASSG